MLQVSLLILNLKVWKSLYDKIAELIQCKLIHVLLCELC